MKKILLLLLIVLFYSCSEDSPNSPVELSGTENVINAVSIDSLYKWVECLSGEKQVIVKGVSQTIVSRKYDQPGNVLAADYLEAKLNAMNIKVENHNYNTTGRNVLGIIEGTVDKNKIYIIGAHYDSITQNFKETAKGADDNASGTAAVLEAARLLSKTRPKYTVIFAFWDEEEIGLIGSKNYVVAAYESKKQIAGVINLDMIAWDSNNDSKIMLNSKTAELTPIVNKTIETLKKYSIKLDYTIKPESGGSDYFYFWKYSYDAVGIIEDYSDFNKYYHTQNDKVEFINKDFMKKCTQLAIGTLCELVL